MEERKLTDESAAEPGGATVLIDRIDANGAGNVPEVTVEAKDAEIARLRSALWQAAEWLGGIESGSTQPVIRRAATRGIANINAALEGK